MATITYIRCAALRLLAERRAQDLIEYALMAGFVAVAAMAFFPPAIAPAIKSIFQQVTGLLSQATS